MCTVGKGTANSPSRTREKVCHFDDAAWRNGKALVCLSVNADSAENVSLSVLKTASCRDELN